MLCYPLVRDVEHSPANSEHPAEGGKFYILTPKQDAGQNPYRYPYDVGDVILYFEVLAHRLFKSIHSSVPLILYCPLWFYNQPACNAYHQRPFLHRPDLPDKHRL